MPAVPAVAPEPEPVKKEPVPAPAFGSFTVEVSTMDGDECRGDVSLGSLLGSPMGSMEWENLHRKPWDFPIFQ